MKRLLICLSVIFSFTITSLAVTNGTYCPAWSYHPSGGGNVEKIIFSDNPTGAWFFDKDGGTFWLPWNNTTHSWGNWQNFDAYHAW